MAPPEKYPEYAPGVCVCDRPRGAARRQDTERNVEHRLNHIIALKASLECVEALREALAPARHPFLVSMREVRPLQTILKDTGRHY